LGTAFADQVILAQGGNSREPNVALVLTPTELVVTGSSLTRITLQDVRVLEGDSIVLRDGTRIPWTPFRGHQERNQMFAAIAEAAGVEIASPTPARGATPSGTDNAATRDADDRRLIAAVESLSRAINSQSTVLETIRNVVIVIGIIMIFFFAALVFGWIKIYPVQ
jgi:hypothetical protein